MDLFTYLLGKKGKNSLVHKGDLFAYLLGSKTKEPKTVSGTTINISDALHKKIESLLMTKESTQDGTPTPTNPQEVITVKNNVNVLVSDGTNTNTYTISLGDNEVCGIGDYKDELLVDSKGHCYINKKVGKVVLNGTESLRKASATDIDRFIWDIPEQQRLWIVDTNSLSNYFEYYTGNRVGSWRNNAGTQLVFNFSTGGTTSLNDFKTWISNHNIICYQPLVTSQLIDLNTTVDITLFQGTNNISNSDNMYMVLKYY